MRLIVNADDFGRHEKINEAVERAVREGCLRSATLMPGGAAFDGAAEIAGRQPALGVGIHFTLANGFPVLPPEEIPSLVTEEGVFYDDYLSFLKRYLKGRVRLAEVRSELAAQLRKMESAGVKLTHADSHQHLHHVPGILGIVLELAEGAGIRALRVSRASLLEGGADGIGQLIGRLGLGSLARYAAFWAGKKGFLMPDHFAGIVAGEAVSEEHLSHIIDHLENGTTEVMLHPGTENGVLQRDCRWQHDFEAELGAVLSRRVLQKLREKGIAAANFRDLSKNGGTDS